MALAFEVLARNGIRRFCLADPMNDAESNVACARMVKRAGGEFVIAALVFTLSPIHDDQHYAQAARKLAACPEVDAIYIKDPGGLLSPRRAGTLIPAVKAADRHQAAGAAFPLHDRPRGAALHGRGRVRGERPAVRRRVRPRTGSPIRRPLRVVQNLRALGHTVPVDLAALAEVSRYFTAIAEAEGLPVGAPQPFDAALPAASAARGHDRHHAPAAGRAAGCRTSKGRSSRRSAGCARSSAGRSS